MTTPTHPPESIEFVYHRPGRGTQSYRQDLVRDEPHFKLLLMKAYYGPQITVDGKPILRPGSWLAWFVFPHAHYDLGAFHHRETGFVGWYTNLCTPIITDGARWTSTDLFLDLWQGTDGSACWLDEDDLVAAEAKGHLGRELADRARHWQAEIEARRVADQWPPDVARRLDWRPLERLVFS